MESIGSNQALQQPTQMPKSVPQNIAVEKRIDNLWRSLERPNRHLVINQNQSTPWVIKGYPASLPYYSEASYAPLFAQAIEEAERLGHRCYLINDKQDEKQQIAWWVLPANVPTNFHYCIADSREIIHRPLFQWQVQGSHCYAICAKTHQLYRYEAAARQKSPPIPILSQPLPRSFESPTMQFTDGVGYIFEKGKPDLYLFDWDDKGSSRHKTLSFQLQDNTLSPILNLWAFSSDELLLEISGSEMIYLSPKDQLASNDAPVKWRHQMKWGSRPFGCDKQYSKIDMVKRSNGDLLGFGFLKAEVPHLDFAIIDSQTGEPRSAQQTQSKVLPKDWPEHRTPIDAQLLDEQHVTLLYSTGLVIARLGEKHALHSIEGGDLFLRMLACPSGVIAVAFANRDSDERICIGLKLFKADDKQLVCLQSYSVVTDSTIPESKHIALTYNNGIFTVTMPQTMAPASVVTFDFSKDVAMNEGGSLAQEP